MDALDPDDPPRMPRSGESPRELWARASALSCNAGADYVERRAVSLAVAAAAGVRFDANFGGRPAVLIAMRDADDAVIAVHGRYLHASRNQDKMLTVGAPGGVVGVLGGWRAEPLILVEGLFDALSLATCGSPCVATIGRSAPWLARVATGREAWLAFDKGRAGDLQALRYASLLGGSNVRRLPPPPRCKDWNNALRKRGAGAVGAWLRAHLASSGTKPA